MSDTPEQVAGWYYAQGDPPGTQRYWDGTQWQGGPQMVPEAGQQGGYGAVQVRHKAPNGKRFVAFLIDALIIVGIYILALMLGSISEVLALVGLLAALVFQLYNQIYLQGTTGQTIGKKQQGITLLTDQSSQPVGAGMALARLLLIMIFAIPCYLDHWWILVDEDNRRLSDKVLKFHVYTA